VNGHQPFQIVDFDASHIGTASALAAQRVAAWRKDVPLIPERWTDPQVFVQPITDLVARNPAAVALIDGAVFGYLAAMRIDWSQGRWAFSPEWANFAMGPNARRIREELYARLAGQWVADDRRAHFVSLFPSDGLARETMQWLGFGTTNVDGLRSLEPLAGGPGEALDVTRATPADVDDVAPLERGLRDHLASTPLFLRYPDLDRGELLETLADESRATLLARDERGPLAMLRIGPSSNDASTIIRDPGTASITRAFTRADRRSSGVARTLLDAALTWTRDNGYVRCAVDFESANLLASRFWTAHFQVVGVTVGRRL
jgi:GNAT superfamily N-acetyltransferase